MSLRDVISDLETDFSESHYEEKVVSQEDLQFLAIMDTNIR